MTTHVTKMLQYRIIKKYHVEATVTAAKEKDVMSPLVYIVLLVCTHGKVLVISQEAHPSRVNRQIGPLAAVNTPHWFLKHRRFDCSFMTECVLCGCRTAIHINDNREDFGWGNEERNGG